MYHCSYRFWNNSKSKAIWAMLLLTAFFLWQTGSNKGRLSSETQHRYHAIKCTFKSLRWLISPKRKKHMPHCTPGSIYAHFPASGLFEFGFFSPVKFSHQNKKMLSWSCLPFNEHFLVSLEFYWTLFLFLPLQLDNSDLWFLFLLVQSLWNNVFQTQFQNLTVFY